MDPSSADLPLAAGAAGNGGPSPPEGITGGGGGGGHTGVVGGNGGPVMIWTVRKIWGSFVPLWENMLDKLYYSFRFNILIVPLTIWLYIIHLYCYHTKIKYIIT